MLRKASSIAPRHVLLVEDDLLLGELLVSVFTRHGTATVSWFVRAKPKADSSGFVLIDPDGCESIFDPLIGLNQNQPVDIAFVDYRLKMSPLTGLEVTRKLTAYGVKVIACSGLPWFNDEMIAAGAQGGLTKDTLFSRALHESDFIDQLCTA